MAPSLSPGLGQNKVWHAKPTARSLASLISAFLSGSFNFFQYSSVQFLDRLGRRRDVTEDYLLCFRHDLSVGF